MRTILVIDDEVNVLQTLCLILKRQGYHAIGAENSEVAQHHFADYKVDLVILDHGLPGISGSELAKKFKAIKWY